MAVIASVNPSVPLSSARSTFRLNQIDQIRANGIGDHIPLPQLAVCGDQSTGKSSVLERVTGLDFPRQDGLCTRFATKIVLRHCTGPMEITATIRPGTNRCQEMRETLEKYRNVIRDFNVLPRVIEEVAALMGIRGFCDSSDARSFALDVLRIDVRGPVGLHLTIVDLPGLISVESDEQSTEDIDAVHRLVETYMESHRTIILAVAQAGNDVANQPVIRKSRKYDPHGLRTIGIITKPDLINKAPNQFYGCAARTLQPECAYSATLSTSTISNGKRGGFSGGDDKADDDETYTDEGEEDAATADKPSKLSLWDAVQTYPELAVDELEDCAKPKLPPQATKRRQLLAPDRVDDTGVLVAGKRLDSTRNVKPLPFSETGRPTWEEFMEPKQPDKNRSMSTRVGWDCAAPLTTPERMLLLWSRRACSSEGSPTNADTLSREEKSSRHRTPSDPLDRHSASARAG
ncbi:Dynamin-A [Colletotrichum fructicola Nara gc5]|uniref:Dynamin-A n=1 Tax=Colletotrichum fructicola (strain Nara gc5) TaxID=1213859 RepID=A0A7J6IH77_COLFN|nr:Dynamin-A [Colletotrichum fructicola Nara gc5]